MVKRGLLERLKAGEQVICAEGYLFELERRGYLKAGAFVPEVVVENPEVVRTLHEEFVHAGSDVVEAFTYYGHRAKLAVIGRGDEVENFNRQALKIAREVADKHGCLLAGNICNSTIYSPTNEAKTEELFKEQIAWAKEAGADFIIGETFGELGEALFALKCIKKYAPGLPAVIMMTANSSDKVWDTGTSFGEACRELEKAGADVVGLNCYRGPDSMLDVIKEVRSKCKGPIACLPVPYRTDKDYKCMQNLKDQRTGEKSFPVDLDSWLCSRSHMVWFTEQLKQIGVQFMGVCCGNRAHYIRAMAETLGRKPPASKYSPDMSQHLSQINNPDQSPSVPNSYNKTFA